MRKVFVSETDRQIVDFKETVAAIRVNADGLRIRDLNVFVDITHTYTGDLRLILETPDGTQIPLANRRGGYRNDVRALFDDDATQKLGRHQQLVGEFVPETSLHDKLPNGPSGMWRLRVQDVARGDQGVLNQWRLEFDLQTTTFDIVVEADQVPDEIKPAFLEAADRWGEVISADIPPADLPGYGEVDDLVIFASAVEIDGSGRILGQAGPTHLRQGSRLPISGVMRFDLADLQSLQNSGLLLPVILHEMGHVLGIGSLWEYLIEGVGTDDPRYTGANAVNQFNDLDRAAGGSGSATSIPLANTGGAGTRESHWRESVFDNELMTGFINSGRNPLSKITAGSLQDLGYHVDLTAADEYLFPSSSMRALVRESRISRKCRCTQFEPVLLDEKT